MTYANRSRSRIFNLKKSLTKLIKDNMIYAEFMQIVKTIVDELVLVGSLVKDDDLVIVVLNRLREEFKEINVVWIQDTPISFEELHMRNWHIMNDVSKGTLLNEKLCK